MPFTNFPQGFANGVSIRGVSILQSNPGKVFYVGNSPVLAVGQRAASDGNRGTFLDPLATLNFAVNFMCVQGRGDIVIVLPGHREILSSNTVLTLGCAGVAIVGVGSGNLRPTFILTGAATTNIPVMSANVSIQNCLFLANFLSITTCFAATAGTATASISGNVLSVNVLSTGSINIGASVSNATNTVPVGTIILNQLTGTPNGVGTYTVNTTSSVVPSALIFGTAEFAIDNCEFRDVLTTMTFLALYTSTTSNGTTSGFSFTRNQIFSLSNVSPTVALILPTGSIQDRWNISDNFGVSPITAVTQGPCLLTTGASSITNFTLARNRFTRPNTSTTIPVGIFSTGTTWTGHCSDNYFWSLNSATGTWISTGTGLAFTNNFSPITGAADKSALINPVAV